MFFFNSDIGTGVRIPATTSSPCAFNKNSPKNALSPVDGFLVKATPVPDESPIFPNTIATTFAAVPRLSGMLFSLRYVTHLAPFHESNTASIDIFNCSNGSLGKFLPLSFLTSSLNLLTISFNASRSRSVSSFTPTSLFFASRISSNFALLMPITISPNMVMNLL